MKIIRLDNQMKQQLINDYKVTLEKEANEKLAKFAVECETILPRQKPHTATDKLKIYYKAEAYAKIVQLVFSHSQEVGWNMVVKRYKDGYRVEDVLVYPQKASGAYIEVDPARYGLWKGDPDKVSDEADANLFGQGHSHVNMGVIPSSRDEQQQKDEIRLKGSGFYLFQIWNKRLDINSFFYDIDNNIMYDKDDIELIVEDGDMTSIDFVAESKRMLVERVVPPAPATFPKPVAKTDKKKESEESTEETWVDERDFGYYDRSVFLDGYWPGYGYNGMEE